MGDSSGMNDHVGDSPEMELTGKIMVIVIILLFFVVVLVCFLHLYAKWCWWRMEGSTTPTHTRRRRHRRRFVFAPGQDQAIHGVQRRGLDPEVLRSIPVLVYQPEDFKNGLECAVCLSELVPGEKARLLPKCNHGFHVECIDMWFQSHSTCPLCRNLVASESFEVDCSSDVRQNVDNDSQSSDSESLDSMSEFESPDFPTNVLIWGDQTQISSNVEGPPLQEPSSSSSLTSSAADSSSSSNNNNRRHGMLVIDIPREMNPSSLASTSTFAEDELKSPMTSRLRSFKRILSMKFSPRSPSSIDVEQGGRGQGQS